MKTTQPHIFELLQAIQDSPLDQALHSKFDKHLAECSECGENMRLFRELQNIAHVRYPDINQNPLSDAQMIAAVEKRVRPKQLYTRLLRPLPGLAWIALAILMVVILSWGISSLRPEPVVKPSASTQSSTITPAPTGIVLPAKDCRDIIYTIAEGDTLLAISAYFNVPLDVLWKENDLENGSVLKPGMVLVISFCGWTPALYAKNLEQYGVTPIKDCPLVNYTVQQGDTLEAISGLFNTPVATIVTQNKLDSPSTLSPGNSLVISVCKNP